MYSLVSTTENVPITLATNATPVPIAYMTSMESVLFLSDPHAARNMG